MVNAAVSYLKRAFQVFFEWVKQDPKRAIEEIVAHGFLYGVTLISAAGIYKWIFATPNPIGGPLSIMVFAVCLFALLKLKKIKIGRSGIELWR